MACVIDLKRCLDLRIADDPRLLIATILRVAVTDRLRRRNGKSQKQSDCEAPEREFAVIHKRVGAGFSR